MCCHSSGLCRRVVVGLRVADHRVHLCFTFFHFMGQHPCPPLPLAGSLEMVIGCSQKNRNTMTQISPALLQMALLDVFFPLFTIPRRRHTDTSYSLFSPNYFVKRIFKVRRCLTFIICWCYIIAHCISGKSSVFHLHPGGTSTWGVKS